MRKSFQNGQLAIGLAVAFTSILTIFSFVFQSALTTNEKMKLQQTTDLAALRGAHVQRVNLDLIRQENEAIEQLFTFYSVLLKSSPCNLLIHPERHTMHTLGPAVARAITPIYAALRNFSSDEDLTDRAAFPNCDSICDRFDTAAHNLIAATYEYGLNQIPGARRLIYTLAGLLGEDIPTEFLAFGRSGFARNIQNRIETANDYAYARSLEIFFDMKNLPLGIRKKLGGDTGSYVSSSEIRWKYEQGEFAEDLAYLDVQQGQPLFYAGEEIALLDALGYGYPTSPPPTSQCYWGLPQSYRAINTKAKVVRVNDYPTSFFAATLYNPPYWNELYNPKLRNPNVQSEDFGQALSYQGDAAGESARLFAKERTPMMAYAFAKPYGGSFPTAATPFFSLLTRGSVGEEFEGAKLIGIADQEAMDGFDVSQLPMSVLIQGEYPVMNAEGNWTAMRFFREDFLH